MEIRNRLYINTRQEFRDWLQNYATTEKECWVEIKRDTTPPEGKLWYLDAVEEALCFGWIDSTYKKQGNNTLQRFSPRKKNSSWSELNKERCRRLIKLGMMTKLGEDILPDLDAKMEIDKLILQTFQSHSLA